MDIKSFQAYLTDVLATTTDKDEVLAAIRSFSGEKASVLGAVGTRCSINDNVFQAGNTRESMTVFPFKCHDDVVGPQAIDILGMSVNSTGVEVIQAGDYTIEGAFQDLSDGTIVRLTYGGNNTGSYAASGGVEMMNDANPSIRFKRDRWYAFRRFLRGTNGLAYAGNWSPMITTAAIDGFDLGTTVTNRVMGGGNPANVGSLTMPPNAIIAKTTRKSIGIIGDSISATSGIDAGNNANGDIGPVARALGGTRAYSNFSRASTQAAHFTLANRPKAIAVLRFFDTIVSMLGRNDSYGSVVANIAAVRALFPNHPFWQCTIMPTVDSGTVAAYDFSDQTTGANNANRVTANNALRNGGGGITGCVDTADMIEPARNVGKFKIGTNFEGTAPFVHPNTYGCHLMSMAPGFRTLQ